jgi:hypothetical protein
MKTEKLKNLLIAAEVARNKYLDLVKETKVEAERSRDVLEEEPRCEEGFLLESKAYKAWKVIEDVLDLIEWEQEKCHGFFGLIMSEGLGDVSWEQEEAISTEHRYW